MKLFGAIVAIFAVLDIAGAQNYSESVSPPGILPLPPYISRSNFDNSGYDGYGQQPVQENTVLLYNGSFAPQSFEGGTQTALYYDAEIPVPTYTGMYAQMVNLTACSFSTPHLHPDVTEMNYVLEGDGLIAGLFLQSNEVASQPTWATGVNQGGIATVPANSVHYAQNPSCGTAVLLQIFAGLPKGYTYVPYLDLPTILLSQDVTAMQFSYGMTDEQVQTAVKTVKPLFAVNQTCVQACQAQGLLPPGYSPSAAPATPASG